MASHRYGRSRSGSRPTLSDILTRLHVGSRVAPAFVKAIAPQVFSAGGGWISRPILGDRIYVVGSGDDWQVRVREAQKSQRSGR